MSIRGRISKTKSFVYSARTKIQLLQKSEFTPRGIEIIDELLRIFDSCLNTLDDLRENEIIKSVKKEGEEI